MSIDRRGAGESVWQCLCVCVCVSLLVRRTLLYDSCPPLIYSVYLECYVRTLFYFVCVL